MKAILLIGGAVLGAAIGLALGALVGGNFATDLELLHLRGYEATGALGLVLGMLLGGALVLRVTGRDYGANSNEMRR